MFSIHLMCFSCSASHVTVSLVEDYPNYMIINLDKVRIVNEPHALKLHLNLIASFKSMRVLLEVY